MSPGPIFSVFLGTWLSSQSAPFTEGFLPTACQMHTAVPESLVHALILKSTGKEQKSLPKF